MRFQDMELTLVGGPQIKRERARAFYVSAEAHDIIVLGIIAIVLMLAFG